MEPISNADRLVLLLRQKLEERSRSGGAARAGAKAPTNSQAPSEPSGVRALAAIEGIDERPLRRAIVQNLIADQLGPELINEAQFQQVVSRVTDAIEDDPDASKLLTSVIAEFRLS